MPDSDLETDSTTELLEDLRVRFSRVERAIMGDPSVGHRGLVTRTEALETLGFNAPDVHAAIDERRIDGDKRIHQRIDEHESDFRAEMKLTHKEILTVSKKVDRIIYVFAGAFLGGLGTGGGVMYAILGGG